MTAINSNLSTFRPNTNKEKFSYSGSGQQTVQSINDISQATKKETVTAETLTLSAGAIGVTGKVRLTYAPVSDSAGAKLGYFNTATDADTSVSITHTALAGDQIKLDVTFNDTQLYASLGNGDYLIDYIYGVLYYKKGHTDTAGTVDYKYTSQEIDLSVSTLSIGDVTSGGVNIAAETTTNSIKTAVELIDDSIYTDGAGTPGKGMLVMGTDGTNPQALSCNTDGELKVNLETADIEIGAVELKNATSDVRADVNPANTARAITTNVLATQVIDAAGAVLRTSTIETDIAKLVANTTATNLNAVTSATDGASVDITDYSKKTVYVKVSGNTGAVTVNIEVSPDDSDWLNYDSKTYTATNTSDFWEINGYYAYVRTTTTTQSTSTVTTSISARGV